MIIFIAVSLSKNLLTLFQSVSPTVINGEASGLVLTGETAQPAVMSVGT